MLLHDIGKPVVKITDENGRDHFKMHGPESEQMAKVILRRLKFDNDTIHKVCRLVKWHDARPAARCQMYAALSTNRGRYFPLYLEVQRADMLAQSTYQQPGKEERLEGVNPVMSRSWRKTVCFSEKSGSYRQRSYSGRL